VHAWCTRSRASPTPPAAHPRPLTRARAAAANFRVNKLEVIPLSELGRPRVDVVVNCSGVFRDLFVNQMLLLDRAIKLAAEQDEPDEMNFVRKHAKQQVGGRARCRGEGCVCGGG